MGRIVLGVIVGYLVMALLVFATFSLAYLVMGADGAFRTGTYEVSPLWLAVSIALSFVAAIGGGWVCAALSRNHKGAGVLAVLVLVLGLAMAIPVLTQAGSLQLPPRTGPVSNTEAMERAQQPVWVVLLNPLIGAFGVMTGSKRQDRR